MDAFIAAVAPSARLSRSGSSPTSTAITPIFIAASRRSSTPSPSRSPTRTHLHGQMIVIAAGSRPVPPAAIPFDDPHVYDPGCGASTVADDHWRWVHGKRSIAEGRDRCSQRCSAAARGEARGTTSAPLPSYVRGAEPGDVLDVRIIDVRPCANPAYKPGELRNQRRGQQVGCRLTDRRAQTCHHLLLQLLLEGPGSSSPSAGPPPWGSRRFPDVLGSGEGATTHGPAGSCSAGIRRIHDHRPVRPRGGIITGARRC